MKVLRSNQSYYKSKVKGFKQWNKWNAVIWSAFKKKVLAMVLGNGLEETTNVCAVTIGWDQYDSSGGKNFAQIHDSR